jgi:hypothetical protein
MYCNSVRQVELRRRGKELQAMGILGKVKWVWRKDAFAEYAAKRFTLEEAEAAVQRSCSGCLACDAGRWQCTYSLQPVRVNVLWLIKI